MAFGGALRNILRPVSARCLLSLSLPLSRKVSSSSSPIASTSRIHQSIFFDTVGGSSFKRELFSTSTAGATAFNSLTDTRFPKRRPGTKPRKKRASLRPRGPFAWVQYVPGEPIPVSRPNEGSVQGRNRKKRIRQRKAFILAEKKKRKAQQAEARKKRDMKRIERKMAAVAREKAWAERLIELQQLEEKKKAAAMA
ncbi:uncharacterized protein LOC135584685 [Musa acuminata AAA Group]|uniref:(wild Malaysian banana) hypothetical protein n=1 Tax=Musa acuminata subsp. malaccensis TaxID=214687 RepID=A0A804K9C6_MUSAM|nr:PREDICTED: uncharacterized protein LOC103995424 [Musa acuminata subsp. malaccensis]XP_009414287.1 PREDICTED: uncharacterized protein LOC103995424 [Musa acuminata subsp. malaccensis]XP_009414288.1 PREDICTED: uncharacterized protein LOC103995424 [Musa acuminata subsp. malaccensis]CAG1832348.1 unnamed protein product [Musa acuminata subsp. malaccensis]